MTTIGNANTTPYARWESAVEKKRAAAAQKIPSAWRLPEYVLNDLTRNPTGNVMDGPKISGILTDRELDITENYTAVQILEKLALKEFTSYEVTLAFSKRAAIAQQLVCYSFSYQMILCYALSLILVGARPIA
jgi:amidase